MSLMKRISLIFRAKADKALDRAEDPRETLDYSYKRQLELLTKVRRGVADVATSRKRVELQVAQLNQSADKLTQQAQKALSVGREDLAREALTRKSALAGQLAVGQVIANRADSGGRFPGTYCGVLSQRGQFSFVHGSKLPTVPHANRQWQTAVAIAKIVDRDLQDSAAGNALFFHARYVSPGWRLKRVASIGNHVFYR